MVRRFVVAVIAALAFGPIARPGSAQDRTTDFAEQPLLVLDTGGHHAPVRRLAFTADGKRLLSAGEDKVVRVWDTEASPPTLGRTIRPPIWRGPAGSIWALALGPSDAQGQQALALGGYGIQSTRGDIGLYRFPGAADRPGGDVQGLLPAGDRAPRVEQTRGHVDLVTCLAFHPRGGLLASAGNDRSVRLWDPDRRVQVDVKAPDDQGAVNAIAFTPDGRLLVTGGEDGILRVWDVSARTLALIARVSLPVKRPDDLPGMAINALDVSHDGRWAVVGREDGALLRLDLANPAAPPLDYRTRNDQGQVEALAIGPDGSLATSTISRRIGAGGDRPAVASEIELRHVLDREKSSVVASLADLAYALAFSPDGRHLAYAGGDNQGVGLVDLRAAGNRRVVDVSGASARGLGIWDVGFVGKASVAYSFASPAEPPPQFYWGFDLADRSRTSFAAAQVRRALHEFDGWSVRPVDPLTLQVVRGGRDVFRVELTQQYDGRWWDYSFLPPGPKHPGAALAVACHGGAVVVVRLSDGLRTRVLAGHEASVHCLAPSEDGRFLATGSADQTVRLWSLAGCDVVAPLGAAFEERNGALTVTSVARAGFADLAGLKVGDAIDSQHLKGDPTPVSAQVFLRDHASLPPNTRVEFRGRHRRAEGGEPVEPFVAGTSRRDRPALSLFVGLDREWVVWMPPGYYDSSVAGDSTFLGWQVNRSTPDRPAPTDFFPLVTNEKKLRQPKWVAGNAIDRLLETGEEAAALGARPAGAGVILDEDRPSRVTPIVGAGGAELRGPDGKPIPVGSPLPDAFAMGPGVLAVDWIVEPWKARAPGPFEVRLSGETILPPLAPPLDPASGVARVAMRSDLAAPGTYAFTALADAEGANRRALTITATVEGKPAPRLGRLRILAVAPSYGDKAIPPIALSDRDVKALIDFFPRHLAAGPAGAFPKDGAIPRILAGEGATAARFREALLDAVGEPLGRGDLLIVLIETHVLAREVDGRLESRLVLADSRVLAAEPEATVMADDISSALSSLTHRGCEVVLVLDGVHATGLKGWAPNVVEWARDLRNRRDVITVLATTGRPSRVGKVEGNRPLARALLDSVRTPGGPALSLFDLKKALYDGVQRLTQRVDEPEIYIPQGISSGAPFLLRRP